MGCRDERIRERLREVPPPGETGVQVGEAGGFWRERVQRRKALLRRSGGSTLKVCPRAPVATGSGGSFKLRCLTHLYLRSQAGSGEARECW